LNDPEYSKKGLLLILDAWNLLLINCENLNNGS